MEFLWLTFIIPLSARCPTKLLREKQEFLESLANVVITFEINRQHVTQVYRAPSRSDNRFCIRGFSEEASVDM